MKKIFALLLVFVLCLSGCGSAQSSVNTASGSVQADAAFYSKANLSVLKDKKIGITIQTLDNAYWAGVMAALEEQLKQYGADYVLLDCDQNTDTQIGQLENFISQKYDLILVHANDPSAVESVCAKALKEGIIVMCWDDHMENTTVNWVLDNATLGKEIGKLAAEFINAHYDASNPAEVAVIEYNDVGILLDRAEGIKAGLQEAAGGKYNIVAEEPGLNPTDSQMSVEKILKEHPDCKVIVGIGSGAMIGANEAYMNFYNYNIPDDVGVITTDVTKRQLNALLSDEACRGIVGFEGSDVDTAKATAAMFAMALENKIGAKEVYRSVNRITTDNVKTIMSEMK